MSKNDFDVAGLACYLHITAAQVERLADRGKIPGRKVSGQWRFSRAEIHHWMEHRMGLLEDDELARVEGVLRGPVGVSSNQPLSICDMLTPAAIAMPLKARTRGSVIKAMVHRAEETGLLWDAEKLSEAVRAREELQSTAMDNGVALLHPRRPLADIVAEPFLVLGITPQGIPFGGSSRLTDIFFLLCSKDDRGHLRTLARLSRLINDNDFLGQLRAAADVQTLHQLLCEREASLPEQASRG